MSLSARCQHARDMAQDCDEPADVLEQDIVKQWEALLAARKPGVRLPVEWDAEIEAGLDEIRSLRAEVARLREALAVRDLEQATQKMLDEAGIVPAAPSSSQESGSK